MIFIAVWPAVIALIGLLLWGFSAPDSKAAKAGYVLFACGALVMTAKLSGKTFQLP